MTNATATTKLVWQPLWNAMRADCTNWVETTEEMYWDMLEVLPPLRMRRGAFLMSEANHSDEHGAEVYACFARKGDDYFARYMTAQQFDAEMVTTY